MSRHPFSFRNTDTTVEITLIGHDFILPVDEAELLATALLFAVLRSRKQAARRTDAPPADSGGGDNV